MTSRDTRIALERRLDAAGVSLPRDIQSSLVDYFGLMAKWNKRLNLTALELEPASTEAIDRLLVEPAIASLSVAPSDSLLIDLGSGGGSPAIPLKLCSPGIRLVMVEVKERKAAFLRDATRQLGLNDVEVANGRFEELLTQPDLKAKADVVSVRAVRADEALWSSIGGLLSPQGRVFWFSSAASAEPTSRSGFQVTANIPLPGTGRLLILRSIVAG